MELEFQILLLGKSVKLNYDYMKDETHSGLVSKLKEEGYIIIHIDRDSSTLNYLQNPSDASKYDLVIYDTLSNYYSFEDEGQKRGNNFKNSIADKLKAMNVPIIILADPYVSDDISKTVKKYGFMKINQPYDINSVLDMVKKLNEK